MTSVASTVIQGMCLTFLRADKFGFTIESCSPPAFPAHKDRGHNVPPWGFTDHRAGGK